jgi:hypothetical protein
MAPQEKSAAQQMTDMAANKAMSETVDYGATKLNESVIQPGLEKVSAMFTPAAAAPTQAAINAAATSSGTAGPLMQQVMGQAAGNAATTAATTGGMGAAMGALGTAVPYIGAAMLAGKAFGLFNKGGHVGPLYAAEGKIAYPSYKSSYSDLTDDEILKLSPREQEEYIKTIGIEEAMDAMYSSKGGAVHANMGGLMPMLMDKAKEEGIPMGLASMLSKGGRAGPLAKVEYKSKGGETYKLSYGGPISKGV